MSTEPTPQGRPAALRDLSPDAFAVLTWLNRLARALKVFRLYRGDNPLVVQTQERLVGELDQLLEKLGGIEFRFTPSEIWFRDERIVRTGDNTSVDGLGASALDPMPFLFYRDGIRRMSIQPQVSRAEMAVLFEALKTVGSGPMSNDDLVTLLWQANLTRIQVDSVPYEQTIFLSSRHLRRQRGGGAHTQTFAATPKGEELRADLGQIGVQGLHKDTFDDWAMAEGAIDVEAAFAKLIPSAERFRDYLVAEWVAENSFPWTIHVPDLMRGILRQVPGEEGRSAVAHSVGTWLAGSIQSGEWPQAEAALELLREVDPGLGLARAELETLLDALDWVSIVERLDEAPGEDLHRFANLAVGLGASAVDLLCTVLAYATRSRTRAAATTALSFLCQDDPELLEPYLEDARWFLVRNVVFVLGQIGGPRVIELLRIAAQHPEPRVRRQVVHSLGNVPRLERMPILLTQLDTRDPQLLAATLQLLTREKDALVARALLDQIESPAFETRSEANRRAMFSALAEVADDTVLPALEAQLHKGGWFARKTLERSATARTLHRIGSERALALLEAGLRSKSEAVRAACLEAMSARGTL